MQCPPSSCRHQADDRCHVSVPYNLGSPSRQPLAALALYPRPPRRNRTSHTVAPAPVDIVSSPCHCYPIGRQSFPTACSLLLLQVLLSHLQGGSQRTLSTHATSTASRSRVTQRGLGKVMHASVIRPRFAPTTTARRSFSNAIRRQRAPRLNDNLRCIPTVPLGITTC